MDRDEIKRALRIIHAQRSKAREGSKDWRRLDRAAAWLEKLLDD